MSDYMTQMLEQDDTPAEPVSIWEVSFECNVSPEGDMMDDSLDVTAHFDGLLAIQKARKYVTSPAYMQTDDGFIPSKFVLKGLRLLATGYIS